MPYIKPDQKPAVDKYGPSTPGELNYAITRLISYYVAREAVLRKDGYSYTALNDVLGALEGAKLEFVRRVVVPYEDRKISINGDVYDSILVP